MRSLLLLLVVLAGCGRTEPHADALRAETLCQAVMGVPQVKNLAAWPFGNCLDVTYSPGAEVHAQGLHAALVEWAGAPGTWLCFNPPQPGAPDQARAVHVEVGVTTPTTVSEVTVRHDLHGALLGAQVIISPGQTLSAGGYLFTAGQVLGFGRTDGVASVLDATTLDAARDAKLTEADLQSVAAVYPACR